jgi:acetoin utilization deacetylase AcuC-like enzyme
MILFFDPRALEYGGGFHPEGPSRLVNSEEWLRERHPDWMWRLPTLAGEADLLRAHSPAHLASLSGSFDFDADTPAYPGILDHARRAAGSAIDSVESALSGETNFSLMRPPGHHASRDRAMGFCYLNSVAVAALYALEQGCDRIAIWDFDAHHGNGTESIVQGNQRIRFASVHQSPGYPGTGGKSFDNIRNFPVPPEADPQYHAGQVRKALNSLIDFKPTLLLVSAGFDAFVGDPITEMTLEVEHFGLFGSWLREVGCPVAPILEGGYSAELPILIDTFLSAWNEGEVRGGEAPLAM